MTSSVRLSSNRIAFAVCYFAWILNFVIRIFLFPEGGIGGWVCAGLFIILTALLISQSLWGLLKLSGKDRLPYALALAGIAAFVYRGVVHTGTAATISAILAFACLAGLCVCLFRDLARNVLPS